MDSTTEFSHDDLVEWALMDLGAGRADAVRTALEEMHPAEVAGLLECLPPEQRKAF